MNHSVFVSRRRHAKVGKKDTETVFNALIKHAQKLPHELYRSLTWDRDKEMADHRRFTLATDIELSREIAVQRLAR